MNSCDGLEIAFQTMTSFAKSKAQLTVGLEPRKHLTEEVASFRVTPSNLSLSKQGDGQFLDRIFWPVFEQRHKKRFRRKKPQ